MIAAQCVADENGVVARGVELAIGFVTQRETGQHLAALESERLGVDEIARHDDAHAAGEGSAGGSRGGIIDIGHGSKGTPAARGGKQGEGHTSPL